MNRKDFRALTPEEFAEASKAFQDFEEARQRQEWERMRLLASISIQPHIKEKLTPRQLIPLPWDTDTTEEEAPKMTHEERMRKAEEARKRLGDI